MEKEDKTPIPKEDYAHYLPSLLEKIKPHKNLNAQKIEQAFWFAGEAHGKEGQLRKSGEPYIMHPVAVAKILVDHYVDEDSTIAALLHDVVEDTPITLSDIKKEFGESVAFLVKSVTNVKAAVENKETKDIQTIRKILASMDKDFRGVYIKLADRIHNLSTLEFMPKEKQKPKAKEAKEIYVGLARRLNLWNWKNTLDDLCLKYLEPELYTKLNKNTEKIIKKDKEKPTKILNQIQNILEPMQKEISNISLVRHSLCGISKILKSNTHPNINNIYYIQIKLKEQEQCYKAQYLIHKNFKVFNSRMRDYFSTPKENGYKALHTTIFCDIGLFDVKIKTNEDKIDNNIQKILNQKIKLRQDNLTDRDYHASMKGEVFSDSMRVYSSVGGEINLPPKSTVLDFILRSYNKEALFFKEIEVNDQKVDLFHKLAHNDIVNVIFGSQKNRVRIGWFDQIKTLEAKKILEDIIGGKEAYEYLIKGYEEFKPWMSIFQIPNLDYIYKYLENHLIQQNKKLFSSFEHALICLGKKELKIQDFLCKLIPIDYFRVVSDDTFEFYIHILEKNDNHIESILSISNNYLSPTLNPKWSNSYHIKQTKLGLGFKYYCIDIESLVTFTYYIKQHISNKIEFEYIF